MTLEYQQTEIRQKQILLDQHRRNLYYLEQQAAQYGPDAPVAIHNALTAERNTIAALEIELAALGVSSQPGAKWQAVVIDPDSHWRKIIVNNVSQLGGGAIECQNILQNGQWQLIKDSAMAIVGISPTLPSEVPIQKWLETVKTLGCNIPLILLVSWDDKDTAIALRQSVRECNMDATVVTIFKENFDFYWFSKIVHQILIR